MLKAHATSCWKSEEYSGKKLTISALFCKHPALEGTGCGGSCKKHGSSCLHAGHQEKKGSMCLNSTPHPVLYTSWETLPEDFQGWA